MARMKGSVSALRNRDSRPEESVSRHLPRHVSRALMRSWSRYTLASDLLPEAAMAHADLAKYFYDLRENALQRMFTAPQHPPSPPPHPPSGRLGPRAAKIAAISGKLRPVRSSVASRDFGREMREDHPRRGGSEARRSEARRREARRGRGRGAGRAGWVSRRWLGRGGRGAR